MFSTNEAELVEERNPGITNNILELLRFVGFVKGAGDMKELEEEMETRVESHRECELNLTVPFGIRSMMENVGPNVSAPRILF